VRSEVAQKVAETLKVRLLGEEKRKIDKKPTENLEAYDAYLKGRYFFNRPSDQNLSKAISQFEDAVRLDPNFAAAYSGLSDAYLWAAFNEGIITAAEGKPKARSSAAKSLQLNEASAEAHPSHANYLSWYEPDCRVREGVSPSHRSQSELRVRARSVCPNSGLAGPSRRIRDRGPSCGAA
jgi:hypothetical protein